VRLIQRPLGPLRPEAQHQLVAGHSAGHVTRDHERDPPEHAPLVEIGDVGEREADALGQGLVEGHRDPVS
jgi:hypothetical protein